MSNAGAKNIITRDMIKKAATLIRKGHYAVTAYKSMGISHDTYYRWLKKGQEDRDSDIDSLHAEFSEEIEKAENQCEIELYTKYLEKAEEDRTSLELGKILARKFPERWSEKHRIELTGKDGGPVEEVFRIEFAAAEALPDFIDVEPDGGEEE